MKPLTPAIPHAIIMIGIPGSGKSAFAERFAETFKAPIINESRLAHEAELDSKQLKKVNESLLHEITKTKSTFLYEASKSTKASRAALIKFVTKAGYKPLVVWVQTESNEALRRANKPFPKGSGLSKDEFTEAVKAFQPPLVQEGAIVISGKHTFASQLKIVLSKISVVTRPSNETPLQSPRPLNPNRIMVRKDDRADPSR